MKITLRWPPLFLGILFALLALPQKSLGVSACLSARFNDYMDLGCHITANKAGGVGSRCGPCEKKTGMPVWWVDEPYVNLWVSDEPLSYYTSSGQLMTFRWTYHERGLLHNTPWQSREYEAFGLTRPLWATTRYSENNVALNNGLRMTNASWNHNWWSEITFWDPYLETNSANTPITYQFGSDPNNPTNAYIQFTQNYQGLLYRGDGGVINFNSTASNTATTSGQVQIQVLNQANANNGPQVPHTYQDFYTGLTDNAYPQYGTFFVTNPLSGFKVVFPDGSQDIYGLVLIYSDVTGQLNCHPSCTLFGPANPRDSTCTAYLTERIDPQGRASLIGYYANTNVVYNNGIYITNFFGWTVSCVVDSDGRTNTYNYSTTNFQQLVSITDPFGRSAQFTPSATCGFSAITDAQTNTTTFSYPNTTNGWMGQMTTPYGTTIFTNYELQESGASNEFEQRALYVGEPDDASQLFYYVHETTDGAVPASTNPPSVTGQVFDQGVAGADSSPHYSLIYRNTYHWDRRQWQALTSSTNQVFSLPSLLSALTASDFTLAHLSHWMLAQDDISVTETLSDERDPSTDSAGQNPGAWTWYANQNASTAPEIDQGAPVSAVARWLSDGIGKYVRYNYSIYAPNVVSDNETSVTLPNGTIGERTNWFGYASTNLIDLLSVNNSAGESVNIGYTNHQPRFITNALDQILTLNHDPNTQNLTGISLLNGQTITLSYYASANPPTSTSSLLEQIEYEPQGLFINIDDYTANLPRIISISGTGLNTLTITNTWDGLNRLTSTTYPDQSFVSNIYTILDLTAHKDRLGNWTYFGYDALEHLTSITNALTNVTQLGWCGCGALSSITDASNNPTYLTYDNQGNLINMLFPDSTSFTYQYDLARRMTQASDASGAYAHFFYNNQGLVTTVSNAFGITESAVYDILDRPQTTTDANNMSVGYTYDLLDRLATRSWPGSITEGFEYGTNGLIAYTNRDQKVTLFGRDAAGRLTSVTNANQEVTQFGYDADGHLTSLIDGNTHQTSFQYDQYGRFYNKLDNNNNSVLQLGYDANGNVKTRWTPASTNTTYLYDALNNLTNISYPGSTTATISFAYDKLNQLVGMVDAAGTTGFSYTTTGQPQSEVSPWTSNTVNFAYNQSHRTSLTIMRPGASAWTNSYSYDSIWRLTGLNSPAGTFGYGYGTTPAASRLVQSISLPNFASISSHYDGLDRLYSTALVSYWGNVLDATTYAYGLPDLRTSITRNLGIASNTVVAGYDNIGQLNSWTASESGGAARLNEQLGYGYDSADNLHLRTNGALVQTFTVNNVNEISNIARVGVFTLSGALPAPAVGVSVNGLLAQTNGDFTFARTNLTLSNGANTFTILATNAYGVITTNVLSVNLPTPINFLSDSNGNLTSDGTRTFVFNAENQLTNVNVSGQWKTEFVYDGLGRRRISRDYLWQSGGWLKTNETRFLYDGFLAIQERNTNNVIQVTYTRGLDLSGSPSGADGIGGLLARTDANGSTFYHADGNGNITALIDGNQNIVARYEFDPYGRLIGKWGTMADKNVMQFSSMPHQGPSGLTLYPFRAYDPTLQRWLNRDPIGETGGINLYGFVGNSPVNEIDPLGLEGNPIMGGGGAWNSDPYGAGGTFYAPGYLWTPQSGYYNPHMPFDLGRSFNSWVFGNLFPGFEDITPEYDDTLWYDLNRPHSVRAALSYFQRQIKAQFPCGNGNIADFVVGPGFAGDLGRSEGELGDPQQSAIETDFYIGYYAFRLDGISYNGDGSYTATILLIDKLGVEEQYGRGWTPFYSIFVGPSREYISGSWTINGTLQ
jgi:RHS repeat-associated protein